MLDVKVVTHGDVDSTAVDVHPTLAVKMDRLTAVDKALFSVALRGFFREIKELEARVARRIMCPDVLQRMEPKLLYITSVTALYNVSRLTQVIVGGLREEKQRSGYMRHKGTCAGW